MKVLVVGSGGREHAFVWKLAQSPMVREIFTAPGNPGTAALGTNVPIKASDIAGLKKFAIENGINLTVVGPEDPLAAGIVDEFEAEGLNIFGPSKAGAELEASKVFCKNLMAMYDIPTAAYGEFDDAKEARAYIEEKGGPLVVKADGLAAGKGVILCDTVEEALAAVDTIMEEKAFGEAGGRVVVEEFLTGEECSYLAITDGKTVVPFAPAQDHKAIYDGDTGPNTGGMGAYSPAPVLTAALEQEVMECVMRPVVAAMEAEGRPYKGILYAGLMITDDGPKVLEFNCRFGDPEAQPILKRLESDLLLLLMASIEKRLDSVELEWSDKTAICVVLSSAGYPGPYEKGKEITGIDEAESDSVTVFHAGTVMDAGTSGERLVTSGGRVLGVTALGDTIAAAIDTAYEAVAKIDFEGAYHRNDIGKKALKRDI